MHNHAEKHAATPVGYAAVQRDRTNRLHPTQAALDVFTALKHFFAPRCFTRSGSPAHDVQAGHPVPVPQAVSHGRRHQPPAPRPVSHAAEWSGASASAQGPSWCVRARGRVHGKRASGGHRLERCPRGWLA